MRFNPKQHLSVYFVADPSLCANADGGARDLVDVVMAAVRGGVSMVQLRDKRGDKAQTLVIAAMLSEMLKPLDIPFLINDDPEIAFAVGADGVHLGQGDMSAGDARDMLGADAIIGQTAFTADHMAAVDPAVVDYVGTGPFYETKTDKGKPVMGAEAFTQIAALSPVPVVGIGGVTASNCAAVIAVGADGVAMMRAISGAADPEVAARDFVSAVAAARQEEAA